MGKENETTTKYKVDISELVKGMQTARRQISLANAEFQKQTAGLDDWASSADGVSAKLTQLDKVLGGQKKVLANLKEQYELTAEQMGEDSREAVNLKIKIENQEAAIIKTEKQIAQYTDSLADIQAQSGKSESAMDKLSNTIGKQEGKLAELKKAYSNAVLEYGKNSKEAKALADEIDDLSSNIATSKKKMDEASKAADDLDHSLDESADVAKNAGNGFTVMKGAISVLIADGLKALASSVKDTMKELVEETDSASSNFQAKTGATNEAMEEYRDIMNEIYKNNYGESLEDVAEAMAEVKQQTGEVDPSKLKELTEDAIALRDTFGWDIKESMRAVNMLMTQFGISGKEAYNLIVQGAQKGLDKNGDFLDTLNEYSVHYKQLGYSAEGFINSLVNGAESGTFSIDKLGDAMKEFGIRTKDTATSTTEGFSLLGYGVRATTEEIEAQKGKVAELEKKLSYATQEQSEFNAKTSELKKQKMADTIADYSKEIENAKTKLAEMEESTSGNVKTAEDLRAEFAAGGESAQKATQEVLKKLMEMDDQVAQNQAGVDLFGTMWEDLGIEGVKALVNTQGEIKKTTKSMEELKKVKYDNIKDKLTQIGRTIKMDLFTPLAQKYVPKAEKFADYCINNINTVDKLLKATGATIATVFVVNKVATFVKSVDTMVTTFKSLKAATEEAAAAQKVLNVLQKASPAGIAALAVGGLVTALVLFSDTSDPVREKWAELSEEEKKNKEVVDQLSESYKSTREAVDAAVSDTQAQFNYYDQLVNELDGLVDANGRVKEGYEERASFIVNTLNDALGTELTMTGDIVDNYAKQKQALLDIIETKKAQIILQANEQAYTDAIASQTAAFNALSNAQSELEKTNEELNKTQDEYNELKNKSIEQWAEENNLTDKAVDLRHSYLMAQEGLKSKIEGLTDKQKTLNETVEAAENDWIGYNTTIKNYEGLSSAIISGDTQKINDSLNLMVNNFITAEEGNKRTLEQQVKDMQENYDNLKQAVESGAPGVTQEMVDAAYNMVNAATSELNKFESKAEKEGRDGGKAVAKGVESQKQAVKSAANEVGEKGKEGLEAVDTTNSGKNFTQGFIDGMNDDTMLGKLSRHVSGLGQKILSWFNSSLGEHSPSKLTNTSGKFFLAGFGNGLDENIGKLGEKVKKMGSSLVDNFNSGLDVPNTQLVKNGLKASYYPAAASAGQATQITNNYSFNQTNNSPKALNRLEIYRQTRNQFNYATGGTV